MFIFVILTFVFFWLVVVYKTRRFVHPPIMKPHNKPWYQPEHHKNILRYYMYYCQHGQNSDPVVGDDVGNFMIILCASESVKKANESGPIGITHSIIGGSYKYCAFSSQNKIVGVFNSLEEAERFEKVYYI